MSWSNKLIKEYGEQIWRDAKRSNRSYEDCSYTAAEVAWAVGECRDKEKFRLAVLRYANEVPKPDDFF